MKRCWRGRALARDTSDMPRAKDVYYVIMIRTAGLPSECKRLKEERIRHDVGGGACNVTTT